MVNGELVNFFRQQLLSNSIEEKEEFYFSKIVVINTGCRTDITKLYCTSQLPLIIKMKIIVYL